jgi:hypothetical protein
MAGKKGRSGRKSPELKLHCQAVVRDVALPKMLACLKSDSPKSQSWRWAFEQFCKLGGLYAPVEHAVEHAGTVEHIHEAAQAFESRIDRITARLGTAAMPEWPERA